MPLPVPVKNFRNCLATGRRSYERVSGREDF